MNEDTLYDVCDSFGLRSGMVYTPPNRDPQCSISCPLGPIRHGDYQDWNMSCSVSVPEDGGPSFAYCHSYNCNFKGSFYRMLEQHTKHKGFPKDLVAVLEALAPTEKFTTHAKLKRTTRTFEEHSEQRRRPKLSVADVDVIPEGRFEPYAGSVPQFALTRGLTKETCKAWGLGNDKKRKCLVFPVRRHDGKLVGMTGRYVFYPDAPSKYHNYAGLNKSRYVYGEHMLERKTPIVVCEGQIDAIITWQHLGLPAVAPLGEGFSREHTRTMCAFQPPMIYIFPDNDQAGRMFAEKVEYQLHGRVPVKVMLPPPSMDPGELTEAQTRRALEHAVAIRSKIDWNDFEV